MIAEAALDKERTFKEVIMVILLGSITDFGQTELLFPLLGRSGRDEPLTISNDFQFIESHWAILSSEIKLYQFSKLLNSVG